MPLEIWVRIAASTHWKASSCPGHGEVVVGVRCGTSPRPYRRLLHGRAYRSGAIFLMNTLTSVVRLSHRQRPFSSMGFGHPLVSSGAAPMNRIVHPLEYLVIDSVHTACASQQATTRCFCPNPNINIDQRSDLSQLRDNDSSTGTKL